MTVQLLTHSRIHSFKVCRRRHMYEYELRWRRDTDAKALRMGTAFHNALEQLGLNNGLEAACESVRDNYRFVPLNFDIGDWDMERETVLRLVCGYDWRWSGGLEYIANEQPFELELTNPATKAKAKTWRVAGKIDGIVRLEDGRLAVLETKTSSDDLGTDSDLWRRLRIDHQISMYVMAARRLGFDVDCVLYDVCRKPTIKPTMVPTLDNLGTKIVLDKDGNRVKTKNGWRQTGDTHLGYVLQQRPMTVAEWGEKLTADIAERPNFYYARVEVPRLDKDMQEFEAELWEVQQAVRDAQRKGHWFRTVTSDCPFCPFFSHCSEGGDFTAPPIGFSIVNDVHPELSKQETPNVNVTTADTPEVASAETASTATAAT